MIEPINWQMYLGMKDPERGKYLKSFLDTLNQEVKPYVSDNSKFNKGDYKRKVIFQYSLLRDSLFEIMRLTEQSQEDKNKKGVYDLAHELELKITFHPTAFCEVAKQSLEERAGMEKIIQEKLRFEQERLDEQRIKKRNRSPQKILKIIQ